MGFSQRRTAPNLHPSPRAGAEREPGSDARGEPAGGGVLAGPVAERALVALGAVVGAVDAAHEAVLEAIREPLAATPGEVEEPVSARFLELERPGCDYRTGGNRPRARAPSGEIAGGDAPQPQLHPASSVPVRDAGGHCSTRRRGVRPSHIDAGHFKLRSFWRCPEES